MKIINMILNWKSILAILLIMIAVGVFAREMFPKVEQVVQFEQAQIDENTWVRRSTYESTRSILQTLEGENEQLYNQVRGLNSRIANFTTIEAELNLQIDSLESVKPVFIPINNGQVADTTIIFTETFAEGLFEIESRVNFWSGYLTNELKVTQLRPIKIHSLTTISKDRRTMFTYVSSPDFKSIQYEARHSVPPQRIKPLHYMLIGAGIVTGIYIIF